MRWLPAALAGVLLVAGCTSSSRTPAPPSVTGTRTEVLTRPATPVPTYHPPPAASVAPLPYGAPTPRGEVERACPYLKTGLDQDSDSGVNLADLEGDRVYRTTVLTGYRPVGCRFYFYAPPYEAIADIRPITFGTATEAYNAMVRTAEAGGQPIVQRNFVAGLTGICFQTRYFGPDGDQDWAFVFAKGSVLVGVYTQRDDTSRNALYIGQAIAAKF